jgi:hypothetical protein
MVNIKESPTPPDGLVAHVRHGDAYFDLRLGCPREPISPEMRKKFYALAAAGYKVLNPYWKDATKERVVKELHDSTHDYSDLVIYSSLGLIESVSDSSGGTFSPTLSMNNEEIRSGFRLLVDMNKMRPHAGYALPTKAIEQTRPWWMDLADDEDNCPERDGLYNHLAVAYAERGIDIDDAVSAGGENSRYWPAIASQALMLAHKVRSLNLPTAHKDIYVSRIENYFRILKFFAFGEDEIRELARQVEDISMWQIVA